LDPPPNQDAVTATGRANQTFLHSKAKSWSKSNYSALLPIAVAMKWRWFYVGFASEYDYLSFQGAEIGLERLVVSVGVENTEAKFVHPMGKSDGTFPVFSRIIPWWRYLLASQFISVPYAWGCDQNPPQCYLLLLGVCYAVAMLFTWEESRGPITWAMVR
jgi:hypothetical protein